MRHHHGLDLHTLALAAWMGSVVMLIVVVIVGIGNRLFGWIVEES